MRWLSPPDRVPELRAEVQVVQPDVDQEAQAVVDLLQDPPADLHLLVGELVLQALEPVAGRCLIASRETWPMCWPAIFTASASGFRR